MMVACLGNPSPVDMTLFVLVKGRWHPRRRQDHSRLRLSPSRISIRILVENRRRDAFVRIFVEPRKAVRVAVLAGEVIVPAFEERLGVVLLVVTGLDFLYQAI